MAFKLHITVDLCMAYAYNADVDELDFDAWSQWVSSVELSQQLSKHQTCLSVAHFYVILTLKTFICFDHLV